MIKIISQDGKEIFDIERTNMFVCGNKILISDRVNIYEGKAACLGIYKDEEQAQKVMMELIEVFTKTTNIDSNFYCAKMPQQNELESQENGIPENGIPENIPPQVADIANSIEEGVVTNGGEQGETGENSKI